MRAVSWRLWPLPARVVLSPPADAPLSVWKPVPLLLLCGACAAGWRLPQVKLWRAASEQGHSSAQCYLGVMCRQGRGTEQSDAEAIKWYRKAAAQGDTKARQFLVVMELSSPKAFKKDATTKVGPRAGGRGAGAPALRGRFFLRESGSAIRTRERERREQKAACRGYFLGNC